MESEKKKFYALIWLGSQKPNAEQEKQLNGTDVIKHILYFEEDDSDNCLKCLQLISNENVLLIVTDTASNRIVVDEKCLAQIHDMHHIKCIYTDTKYSNRHLSQRFPKVRYILNQNIYHHIEADVHAHAQITEPFVFDTFDERSSLGMNGDFMYSQMLLDSFIQLAGVSKFFDDYSSFDKSKNEFLKTCREIYIMEPSKLTEIAEFEVTYTLDEALSWYTRDSFVYKLLNKALRTNDIRLILIFRFFIIDLHRQLYDNSDKLLVESNDNDHSLFVYRGQLMSKQELNGLRKSLGNIISMKSFLSTSLNKQLALMYLGENDDRNELSLNRVLFEIDIDEQNCSTFERPFANITEFSYFGEVEQEVLFMAGSCFHVVEIRRGEKGIWYVRLGIRNQFDSFLRSKWDSLYDCMKTNFIDSMLLPPHIGNILFQSGKFDEAQSYYKQLIRHLDELVYEPEEIDEKEIYQSTSYSENKKSGVLGFIKDLIVNRNESNYFEHNKTYYKFICYYALGRITNEKGLFDQSIIYYNAVLNQSLPSYLTHEQPKNSTTHVLRALCRLGLGVTYERNGMFQRAFTSYTKAMEMFEQAHDGLIDCAVQQSYLTYIQKAQCLIGLGNLRLIEQQHERARLYYKKALSLFDKYLPAGHPNQSLTRQKIANIIQIYECKPAFALQDYEDCLENYLRALPSDHIDIARVYTDMARTYEQMPNELKSALEYAKKARDIFTICLPKEHTDNVTICMIIARIERKM
ncbi:hypothetical protein I4U23_004545 [Adineta vaga]|nr:hypothetical protein I4U23_004545 [Adineta vaga]